ncbi:hypothetical protein ACM64Y_01675 [Novispirillum sp. DQ9]|uniref:hypothetical protein n=1 Tax=Novispirillum sp. DQ9 TaxID=3398612 RepID=UPI003C7DC186
MPNPRKLAADARRRADLLDLAERYSLDGASVAVLASAGLRCDHQGNGVTIVPPGLPKLRKGTARAMLAGKVPTPEWVLIGLRRFFQQAPTHAQAHTIRPVVKGVASAGKRGRPVVVYLADSRNAVPTFLKLTIGGELVDGVELNPEQRAAALHMLNETAPH